MAPAPGRYLSRSHHANKVDSKMGCDGCACGWGVQVQLKGHRSVGGMRASIYNSMPLAGVEHLANFMADFQAKHA